MSDIGSKGGLQIIFSVFVGLMVTSFVGVGVYTFYPSLQEVVDPQIEDVRRREAAVMDSRPADALTLSDREQLRQLREEREDLVDALEADVQVWGRETSIVLIVFATLVMAVSLVRADRLPVISNGLLLGGVFTMLYGVGWIIASATSVARFIVMSCALAITLGLGYLRFVRRQLPVVDGEVPVAGESLEELQERLRRVEDRMRDAAAAFLRDKNL